MSCFAVELLGWITIASLSLKATHNVAHFIYTSFLGSLLGRNINISKCGPWAVVTGGTDGIGKSFARKLAAAGLDIVLISRTPAKLKATADELKAEFRSIQVKTIAVDFTDGSSIYPKLKTELSGLQIGMLINNVGVMTDFCLRFNEISEKIVSDIVNCNMMSMVRMCHIVLPQMIQRKKGVIINIGSISSAIPTPLLTTYGASKSFVDKFSQDLAAEMRPLGITIQTVHPSYVATNLINSKGKSSFGIPGPDEAAAGILRSLGLEDRTGGYWIHKIILCGCDWVNYFAPRRIFESRNLQRLERTKAEMSKSR